MTKCKICRAEYDKQFISQKTCGDPICKAEQKRQEQIERDRRKDIRDRKTAIRETYPFLVKKLDTIFCKCIRERDKNNLCICCDMPLQSKGKIPTLGGDFDAGHFVPRASMATRWDANNVHGQRKYCNQFLSGNYIGFEEGLIRKIGLDEVIRLKSLKKVVMKFTREELRDKIEFCQQWLKQLQGEKS